ncbi:EbsA family protein [Streptococcus sciuri]|uniref:EbsA family protein n=1 Tax=Streptococcus sciuri TaxID=2973939 RepID=A0ABT2F608_9STRE|nr:EbsA family protein [Streptococcus sciuri]MCS4487820.1 EbsA family protein [Streptococcus sciuri]
MIKLLGKVRYHWQPELSWLIIYWSIAFIPVFLGAALIFENLTVSKQVLMLFAIFIVLLGVGFHRYFVIENGRLGIVSLNVFRKSCIPLENVTKVEVTKSTVTLYVKNQRKRTFYMRKWPKKYFIDALTVDLAFQGEVELVDNFIKLDYFKTYENEKKALTKS